jgi:hypothetical protein
MLQCLIYFWQQLVYFEVETLKEVKLSKLGKFNKQLKNIHLFDDDLQIVLYKWCFHKKQIMVCIKSLGKSYFYFIFWD